jgi:hypothetical protein
MRRFKELVLGTKMRHSFWLLRQLAIASVLFIGGGIFMLHYENREPVVGATVQPSAQVRYCASAIHKVEHYKTKTMCHYYKGHKVCSLCHLIGGKWVCQQSGW